jgi:hypothetical protein
MKPNISENIIIVVEDSKVVVVVVGWLAEQKGQNYLDQLSTFFNPRGDEQF